MNTSLETIHALPRVKLHTWPTPLEPARRLTRALDGPEIWLKRDDVMGLALGGNKVRKLEFLLGEALRQGADTVVTVGALHSNHCRLTAAAAARLGLGVSVLLQGEPPGERQGNLLLDHLLGAEIHIRSWRGDDEAITLLDEIAADLRAQGRKPFIIPWGGSTALGVMGYTLAIRELAEQARSQGLAIDVVISASSSGSTQAGLLLGKALFDLPFDVWGVSVGTPAAQAQEKVEHLFNAGARLLDRTDLSCPPVIVWDQYVGPGYGQMDETTRQAIRFLARHEGVLVDPVYTGKVMAGLIDLVGNGRLRSGQTVVFVHTGGVPGVFAQAGKLLNGS